MTFKGKDEIHARIDIPRKAIIDFCQKWEILELSLFGSVLRDDFRPDSDVDILVSFHPHVPYSLFDLVRMEEDLQELLGRKVDLVEKTAIERSRNPLRRREILESAEVLYAA